MVADELTRRIVNGVTELPTEGEIASDFKVAHGTAREAVTLLVARGLVKRVHGIGLRVCDVSNAAAISQVGFSLSRRATTYRSLLEVRGLMEPAAAAWSAERAGPGNLQRMAQAVAFMERRDADSIGYAQADLDFHIAVAEGSGNPVLDLFVEAVRRPLLKLIVATVQGSMRPEWDRSHHRKILEAIQNHDAAAAAQKMREHLEAAAELLAGRLDERISVDLFSSQEEAPRIGGSGAANIQSPGFFSASKTSANYE
jgi:DNA-binding FadR family transcriptional regulator